MESRESWQDMGDETDLTTAARVRRAINEAVKQASVDGFEPSRAEVVGATLGECSSLLPPPTGSLSVTEVDEVPAPCATSVKPLEAGYMVWPSGEPERMLPACLDEISRHGYFNPRTLHFSFRSHGITKATFIVNFGHIRHSRRVDIMPVPGLEYVIEDAIAGKQPKGSSTGDANPRGSEKEHGNSGMAHGDGGVAMVVDGCMEIRRGRGAACTIALQPISYPPEFENEGDVLHHESRFVIWTNTPGGELALPARSDCVRVDGYNPSAVIFSVENEDLPGDEFHSRFCAIMDSFFVMFAPVSESRSGQRQGAQDAQRARESRQEDSKAQEQQ